MKKLAIIGHATRGKEVIEILGMLGGKGERYFKGNELCCWYYINENGDIAYKHHSLFNDTKVFTIEEFLEKYPYKVGDKVITNDSDKFIGTITDIRWQGDSFFVGKEEGDIVYTVQVSTTGQITYQKEQLQPYKETMEEIKVDIPRGYEFAGVDDYNQKVVFTKIQPQYPKTYKECCKVLGVNPSFDIRMLEDEENTLYFKFIDLVRCRNAFWKIAGEEIGLDKPWEPDFKDNQDKYFICYLKDEIWKSNIRDCNRFLVFPTEKIRDEFYENFKDLIEDCKNLI